MRATSCELRHASYVYYGRSESYVYYGRNESYVYLLFSVFFNLVFQTLQGTVAILPIFAGWHVAMISHNFYATHSAHKHTHKRGSSTLYIKQNKALRHLDQRAASFFIAAALAAAAPAAHSKRCNRTAPAVVPDPDHPGSGPVLVRHLIRQAPDTLGARFDQRNPAGRSLAGCRSPGCNSLGRSPGCNYPVRTPGHNLGHNSGYSFLDRTPGRTPGRNLVHTLPGNRCRSRLRIPDPAPRSVTDMSRDQLRTSQGVSHRHVSKLHTGML
jgi:hypothetical protein